MKLAILILLIAPLMLVSHARANQDKEIIISDPHRDYYDLWGNQWSWDGKLKHAVCPYTDPISRQPNPECPQTSQKVDDTQPVVNGTEGK